MTNMETASLPAASKPVPVVEDLPMNDEFRRQRAKRQASRKSVRRFFGTSMHTDLSLKEIEKNGLCALLQSNVPLAFFLHFSLQNYNAENLFFYLQVESFEEYDFKDDKCRKLTAKHIYDAFIKPGADFELNLGESVRQPIQAEIDKGNRWCFGPARDHVITLMDFERYMMSEEWRELRDELMREHPNSSMYPKAVRDKAVLKLVDWLMTKDGTRSSLDANAERRLTTLREMIHDFCKVRLRCDFHDRIKSDDPAYSGKGSKNSSKGSASSVSRQQATQSMLSSVKSPNIGAQK